MPNDDIDASRRVHELAAEQARRNAELYLRELYHLDLRITGLDARSVTWLWPSPRFSWPEIMDRDFGPATLSMAVWVGDAIEVVAICTGHGPQVIIRHVEGRPDGHIRLKGQRLWAVLEVAANFATALGKREIWWHPEREEFLDFASKQSGRSNAASNVC